MPYTEPTRTEIVLASREALRLTYVYPTPDQLLRRGIRPGQPFYPGVVYELTYRHVSDEWNTERRLTLRSDATGSELGRQELGAELDAAIYPLRAWLIETPVQFIRKNGPNRGTEARYLRRSLEVHSAAQSRD